MKILYFWCAATLSSLETPIFICSFNKGLNYANLYSLINRKFLLVFRSELTNLTGFFLDYAGIGLYALGGSITHYRCSLHADLVGTWMHALAAQSRTIAAACTQILSARGCMR